MVVKAVVLASFLVLGSFAFASPTVLACHETGIGCLSDCSDPMTQGTLYDVEADCADTTHPIGMVQDVVVYGRALLGSPPASASVMATDGDEREGYVEFWFEWNDAATQRDTVQVSVELDGHVDFTGGEDGNLTFTASSTQETLTFPFTVDGDGHRNIPFTVRGSAAGAADESVEGVFTVPADEERDGGFWSKDVAGRYWYWLLLVLLAGILLGVWVARRMVAPARSPGLPPLAA